MVVFLVVIYIILRGNSRWCDEVSNTNVIKAIVSNVTIENVFITNPISMMNTYFIFPILRILRFKHKPFINITPFTNK